MRNNFLASKEMGAAQMKFVQDCLNQVRKRSEINVRSNTDKPIDRPTTPSMMMLEQGATRERNTRDRNAAVNALHKNKGINDEDEEMNESEPQELQSRPRLNRTPPQSNIQKGRNASKRAENSSIVYNDQSINMEELAPEKREKVPF
jgi:hypothetical protein